MASLILKESILLIDSIVAKLHAHQSRTTQLTTNAEDTAMFMHILDCIGALSCIRAEQLKKKKSSTNTNEEGRASALLSCKHHVFWQAVRKIADREARLEDIAAATISHLLWTSCYTVSQTR